MFVRDFLGHSKLATTDRHRSAKLRPEELKRLENALAPAGVTDATGDRPPEPETIPTGQDAALASDG